MFIYAKGPSGEQVRRAATQRKNLKADADEEKITTGTSRAAPCGARGDVGVKAVKTH